jgi:uncharacterized protein involved in outer membrane biogenesis
MKKFLRSVLGLVVISVLALIIIIFVGWSRIPDMVANHLSKTLNVLVEIADIELSLKRIGIDKLDINNPKGYSLPKAFSADRISIYAPLIRYLKNDIEIDEITVDNIYLGLEFDTPRGVAGNWTDIIHNANLKTKKEGSSPKKTVFIHRIILTNIHTDLIYHSNGDKVRKLPVIKHIELKNISSEGGGAIDQILNSALGEMLKQVFIEQNLNDLFENVIKPNLQIPSIPGGGANPFKGLFNTTPSTVDSYPSQG